MTSIKSARSPSMRGKHSSNTSPSRTKRAPKSGTPKGIPAPHHPSSASLDEGAETQSSQKSIEAASTTDPFDMLKKPELLRRLGEETGLPKSRLRPVMEAMLAILGEAVAEEREVQLPPLGKIKPLRSKLQGTTRISHVKIRQSFVQKTSDRRHQGGKD